MINKLRDMKGWKDMLSGDKKDGFSVITVTNRPEFAEKVIENFSRQSFKEKELIIIINNDTMRAEDFPQCEESEEIHIYKEAEETHLGKCFDIACSRAAYRYLAKFDDDDYYGKFYLQETYDAFKKTNADLVCKHGIFYYFVENSELRVRFYFRDRIQKIGSGAGCTLCFTWETFQKVRFSDLANGIDVDFLVRGKAMGITMYSTTSYNFCGIRYPESHHHTWRISDEEVKQKADQKFIKLGMTLEEACQYTEHYPV